MNDETRRVMFVGGAPSELLGLLKFRRFGQVEELPVQEVMNAARGGSAILPADDPSATAFTTALAQRAELARLVAVVEANRAGGSDEETTVFHEAQATADHLTAEIPVTEAELAKELERYASFGSHEFAPAEFREKVRAARGRAHDFAREMEAEFQAGLDPELGAAEEVTRG